MRYDEQFYIGKIPVWHAEVDGVPLKKTDHPRNYLFPSVIHNKDHAQQLLDHFSLISIDLREDYAYGIFGCDGVLVGPRYDRHYDHRVVKPPPFPRELKSVGLFRYLCEAEKVLERLQNHFRYLVDHASKLPKEIRGELSNLTTKPWVDTEKMKALTIGLHEKPRRKTSLAIFLENNPD